MDQPIAEPARTRRSEVTSVDVAREAGVSQATVSLVMSGKAAGRISEATAESVRRCAKELGYRPNVAARALRSGAAAAIGLVVADVTHPFFGRTLRGAQRAAREAGHAVVLIDAAYSETGGEGSIDALPAGVIDGFVFFHTPPPAWLEAPGTPPVDRGRGAVRALPVPRARHRGRGRRRALASARARPPAHRLPARRAAGGDDGRAARAVGGAPASERRRSGDDAGGVGDVRPRRDDRRRARAARAARRDHRGDVRRRRAGRGHGRRGARGRRRRARASSRSPASTTWTSRGSPRRRSPPCASTPRRSARRRSRCSTRGCAARSPRAACCRSSSSSAGRPGRRRAR